MSLESNEKSIEKVPELLPDLTKAEKKYIKSVGSFITKYQVEGEDRHLDAENCQALVDFIGENGALFLVNRNGKPYYSSNFSYPKDASPEQLERIFLRMAAIVRERIDEDESAIEDSVNKAGALS